jgi:hypothetical protein
MPEGIWELLVCGGFSPSIGQAVRDKAGPSQAAAVRGWELPAAATS